MASSYNGWPASPDPRAISIDRDFEPLPGHRFPAGVKRGDVSVVFTWLVQQLDKSVEPIELYSEGDEWGYYYRLNRNSDNLSCHASGTAIDYNATRHPNGRRGTFTRAQVERIRSLLNALDGVVRWGGDFNGTPDEMHFEIAKSPAEVAVVARRLRTVMPADPAPPDEKDDDMPLSATDIDRVADEVHRRINKDLQTILRGEDHPSLTKILNLLTKVAKKIGAV